MFTVYLQTRVS